MPDALQLGEHPGRFLRFRPVHRACVPEQRGVSSRLFARHSGQEVVRLTPDVALVLAGGELPQGLDLLACGKEEDDHRQREDEAEEECELRPDAEARHVSHQGHLLSMNGRMVAPSAV